MLQSKNLLNLKSIFHHNFSRTTVQFDLAEAFNIPHAHKDLILAPLNTHFILYQG